jgi:hypothetical protein
MNETKKSHINHLVTQYHETKDEAQLETIYRSLQAEYKAKLNYWSATTKFLSGEHEVQAVFDDAFMNVLATVGEKGGDFVKLFQLRLTSRFNSLLRKVNVRRRNEQYETDNGDEDAANIEIASDFSTEDYVIEKMTAKQKADQRQLIDSLVCGENERTTAIVQTYLTTDLKTPTAIGNHLGLNHKQVTRALNRLAAKFNPKQHGSHRDYLVAL